MGLGVKNESEAAPLVPLFFFSQNMIQKHLFMSRRENLHDYLFFPLKLQSLYHERGFAHVQDSHYEKRGCKVLLGGKRQNTSEASSREINLHGDEEQSEPPPPPPHAIYLQPKQDRVNSSDAVERKHDNTAYKAEQIVSKCKELFLSQAAFTFQKM